MTSLPDRVELSHRLNIATTHPRSPDSNALQRHEINTPVLQRQTSATVRLHAMRICARTTKKTLNKISPQRRSLLGRWRFASVHMRLLLACFVLSTRHSCECMRQTCTCCYKKWATGRRGSVQNGVAQRVEKYGGNVAETSIRSKVRTSPWEVRKTNFSARSARRSATVEWRPAVSAPNNVLVCVCVCVSTCIMPCLSYILYVVCILLLSEHTHSYMRFSGQCARQFGPSGIK